MKNTITYTRNHARVICLLLALVVFITSALAFSASADTRGSVDRDRGTTGRLPEPTPPPPSTGSGQAAPTPTPPPPSGGITSVTDGSVNSGGNQGGTVVTGDEHVSVVEINIGPTNPPPPPPPEDEEEATAPPPAPAPQCDGRSRTGCTDTSSRTR